MEKIFNYFSNLTDPRSQRNQKHPLNMLIGTTLLASLSGIDSFSGFSDFTASHLESLQDYFDFPHGVPSHDTYQRLWDGINPQQFYQSFSEFTDCLAQLRDGIISLDAMGTQRAICDLIVSEGGHYMISLKGNQGSLHQEVMEYFEDDELRKTCCSSEENDKGHGRIEQRLAYACDEIAWLQSTHDWPHLNSIGMVKSRVERKGKITEEKRFYISSLPADARQLNHVARCHWGIENQLHWRLDVVFNEDGSCIRNDNAAENIDILRKWALNVLQKVKIKPEQSIKSVMRRNSMSFKQLVQNVKKIFHA